MRSWGCLWEPLRRAPASPSESVFRAPLSVFSLDEPSSRGVMPSSNEAGGGEVPEILRNLLSSRTFSPIFGSQRASGGHLSRINGNGHGFRPAFWLPEAHLQ